MDLDLNPPLPMLFTIQNWIENVFKIPEYELRNFNMNLNFKKYKFKEIHMTAVIFN